MKTFLDAPLKGNIGHLLPVNHSTSGLFQVSPADSDDAIQGVPQMCASLMNPPFQVVDTYPEKRISCAEMPPAGPMYKWPVTLTAQGHPPLSINGPEEFSERAFTGFLEVAPDAVVIVDRDGHIVRINAQTERMFQYSRAELLGLPIEVLIPEQFREQHSQLLADYSAEPTHRPMGVEQKQVYGLRKDGHEFPVEISLGVLPTEAGFLMASAIRDVSERRRLEAAINERTQQLEDSNRNKDEFLGVLAHELRNPLAVTSMTVDLLRHSPHTEAPEQLWDVVSRQTSQMLHLVDDLMDVSRIAHGKVRIQKVPVDLGPLISQAIEAVQPLLNARKQHLTVSLPSRPLISLADSVRLVGVFTNLLNNAAKYTNDGGKIWVIAEQQNDQVVVKVCDNGIGVPVEMLPRIFDPFFQLTGSLNRSEGGLGIGLAMVAHLVRLHGGTIQVFSEGPGCGSQFVVCLPSLHSPETEYTFPKQPELSAYLVKNSHQSASRAMKSG